jgi:kelch-like protein 2/3
VAVVRGRVYAVGGFNGSLRVRTVDVYDPATDTWSSIASMEARRSTLGVAVLNEYIYAVGGFDGSAGLNTAEVRYRYAFDGSAELNIVEINNTFDRRATKHS